LRVDGVIGARSAFANRKLSLRDILAAIAIFSNGAKGLERTTTLGGGIWTPSLEGVVCLRIRHAQHLRQTNRPGLFREKEMLRHVIASSDVLHWI
jgi:hypothetical protein